MTKTSCNGVVSSYEESFESKNCEKCGLQEHCATRVEHEIVLLDLSIA